MEEELKLVQRPLIILRPFGPVAFVFELSDTEGDKPFPEELINPFRTEGEIPDSVFHKLVSNMINDGIAYIEVEHGTSSAGFIQVSDSRVKTKIVRNSKEIWIKIVYEMVVNRNHNKETKFATILHELGHAYCGHLGTPNEKWRADRRGLHKNEREFEAESVCWLICERMGIKNPSVEYLSGYLNKNDEIPNISIDTVLKAVGIIESLINGNKELRKELVIKLKSLR